MVLTQEAGGQSPMVLPDSDPIAVAAVRAVREGDIAALRRLLLAHPGLAAARTVGDKGSSASLLHAVTDWPGFFPHGAEVARILIDAGADPNARVAGSFHTGGVSMQVR